jgi:spore coat polysaccharide biosynthesis predicted glycosyltransferase SpsG
MRYILRADASQTIGSGHVMRSSAIAEELLERGQEVIFIGVFSDIPWLVMRIYDLGFSQILTSSSDFISNPATDVLILDSYIVPVEEKFIQQNNWKSVITIVDELTPEYKADLMIHPGLSANWIQEKSIKILSGPKYIPLRKSIRKNQGNKVESGHLEILIVGGGTDTFNFVGAVSVALMKIKDDFHARIFTSNSGLTQQDSRFERIPIGSELDKYASTAHLVFTTASTTSLEFIAREVAVGIGCAVDNQEEYYEALSSTGVAMPVGRRNKDSWQINQSILTELVRSKDLRRALRQKCAGLIDLNGSARIVDEILKL